MATQNDTGGKMSSVFHICHVDLLGPELADELRWIADFKPEAFIRLVKTLSENNHAIESALLRRWRIWR